MMCNTVVRPPTVPELKCGVGAQQGAFGSVIGTVAHHIHLLAQVNNDINAYEFYTHKHMDAQVGIYVSSDDDLQGLYSGGQRASVLLILGITHQEWGITHQE